MVQSLPETNAADDTNFMTTVAPIVERTPIAHANENAVGVGAADASACKRLQAVVLGQVHRAELNLRAMLCMQMLVRLALGQGRLHVALPWQQDLGRLLNWGAKDVSLALHGGEDQGRKVRGLVEMGLVDLAVSHLPPSGALGGNKPAPGCLVTVRVDWRRWDVKWRYAEGDWAAAASRVNAYWAQLGRQCEMSEIRERFQLNELMLAEEVQRALSYTNVESSVVALNDVPVAPNGAQDEARRIVDDRGQCAVSGASGGLMAGQARRSCEVGGEGVQLAVVAPNGGDNGGDGLGGKVTYRNGKCELPAKAGDLPKRETGRARAPVNSLTGNSLTVQPLNGFKDVPAENRLLADIRLEFARAHGQAAADRELVNYGGAWRKVARHWPAQLESATSELRHRITRGEELRREAWFFLAWEFRNYIGLPPNSTWPDVWLLIEKIGDYPLTARDSHQKIQRNLFKPQ